MIPQNYLEHYRHCLARAGLTFDPDHGRHAFCRKAFLRLCFDLGVGVGVARKVLESLTAQSTRPLDEDLEGLERWVRQIKLLPPAEWKGSLLPEADRQFLEELLAVEPRMTKQRLGEIHKLKQHEAKLTKGVVLPANAGAARAVVLSALFEPGELVLIASRRDAGVNSLAVRPVEKWVAQAGFSHEEEIWPFIVPNPAVSVAGPEREVIDPDTREKVMRRSPRFRENFPVEAWVVVEFDQLDPADQPHVLWHLSRPETPLCMVIWSGGKSFHGWFQTRFAAPEAVADLKSRAARAGADPATLKPCQLVRAPYGERDDGEEDHQGEPITATQSVLYFDPTRIRKNQS